MKKKMKKKSKMDACKTVSHPHTDIVKCERIERWCEILHGTFCSKRIEVFFLKKRSKDTFN